MDIKRFRQDPLYKVLWMGRIVLVIIAIVVALLIGYLGRHVFGLF